MPGFLARGTDSSCDRSVLLLSLVTCDAATGNPFFFKVPSFFQTGLSSVILKPTLLFSFVIFSVLAASPHPLPN